VAHVGSQTACHFPKLGAVPMQVVSRHVIWLLSHIRVISSDQAHSTVSPSLLPSSLCGQHPRHFVTLTSPRRSRFPMHDSYDDNIQFSWSASELVGHILRTTPHLSVRRRLHEMSLITDQPGSVFRVQRRGCGSSGKGLVLDVVRADAYTEAQPSTGEKGRRRPSGVPPARSGVGKGRVSRW